MIASWAPERMNSCMSWRVRHTVTVQNSLGLATTLAHRTTSSLWASWRRTRADAIIMGKQNRAPRRRERVVTTNN